MSQILKDVLYALAWGRGGHFKISFLTFDQAKELWEKKKKDLKIGYETWLIKTNKGYGIQHYRTTIVEILPHDLYKLDNGGYYSSVTKQRLDIFAPISISSEKGEWYVYPKGSHNKQDREVFRRGMIVDKDGHSVT